MIPFPEGYRLERLHRNHPRSQFSCGEIQVDDWLATKALQQQQKHLSVTRVLLDAAGAIAGYYTLATNSIDFGDLPPEIAKGLPRRLLPAAVVAWFGISVSHKGQGLGSQLLAQALRDCYHAGKTLAYIAVIVDAINDAAKAFYQKWDFAELPGRPYRLYLSAKRLEVMMQDK